MPKEDQRRPEESAVMEQPIVIDELEVGESFSATALMPTLLTHGEHQYVAYFSAAQQITLAHRRLDERRWHKRRLPLYAAWDNHRGRPALGVDAQGLLHLSANMHGDPLVYWRSTRPHDLDSLKKIDCMTGDKEHRVTYPQFRHLPDGRLTFWYRHGGSGNDQRPVNVWNEAQQRWHRLMDQPLWDGREHGSYPAGPFQDQHGHFHYCFMWRQSPNPNTNYHLCYCWTRDLQIWYTAAGNELTLPITPRTQEVIVDPVPQGQGLINMNHAVGFDAHGRPIVAYHKYDPSGHSQIFNARWERHRWVIYQTSHWNTRWDFPGAGAIPALVQAGPVETTDDGLLQRYHHWQRGSGVWQLSEETLQPVGPAPAHGLEKPSELQQVRHPFTHADGSQMSVFWHEDSGASDRSDAGYVLRQESLPAHQDQPRTDHLPAPTPLRLYQLKRIVPEHPRAKQAMA